MARSGGGRGFRVRGRSISRRGGFTSANLGRRALGTGQQGSIFINRRDGRGLVPDTYDVFVTVRWTATATVSLTWRRSGSGAESVSFQVSGTLSYSATRLAVDEVESAVENIIQRAEEEGEAAAFVKATQQAAAAVSSQRPNDGDYLSIGQVSISGFRISV